MALVEVIVGQRLQFHRPSTQGCCHPAPSGNEQHLGCHLSTTAAAAVAAAAAAAAVATAAAATATAAAAAAAAAAMTAVAAVMMIKP